MSSSSSCSKSLNECKVVSKYFASKTVMEDSLTEFQEKIKKTRGPKATQTTKIQTKKTKAAPKRTRGQKDIRTALKSKKNELVAYSDDFHKVCVKSGIDVDPEQLQLAIALSKSLQSTDDKVEKPRSPLNSQERVGKIRTTLQEYGFVVPETKVTTTRNRHRKKYRKQYKLLLTSEEEKQQIVSDRYSKALFNHFESYKTKAISETHLTLPHLYYLTTDACYDELKQSKKFYIDNLVEVQSNKIGCLLKDWSEIPGRPSSPVRKNIKLNLDKLECTLDELDSILSGCSKTCREIVNAKECFLTDTSKEDNSLIEDNITQETVKDTKMQIIDVASSKINFVNKDLEVLDVEIESQNVFSKSQTVRSCSPDIFDDDLSAVTDDSMMANKLSQETISSLKCSQKTRLKHNMTKICEEVMDLTECVNHNSQRNEGTSLVLSQKNNLTNTNDQMEITECVTGSSQPIREAHVVNVDLTKNCTKNYSNAIGMCNGTVIGTSCVESMDLTQSSDSNELPHVQISGSKSLDDTIIMNEADYVEHFSSRTVVQNVELTAKGEVLTVDLESSIDLEESVDCVEVLHEDKLDKSNISTHKSQFEIAKARAISPIEIENCNHNLIFDDVTIVHKISTCIKSPKKQLGSTKSKTESFFEEFAHIHSESSNENAHDTIEKTDKGNSSLTVDTNEENNDLEIDLTQSSNDSTETTNFDLENKGEIAVRSIIGEKTNNLSEDFDQMFDDMIRSHTSSRSVSYETNSTNKTNILDKPHSTNSNLVSNSSQKSEVFEISDNKLDNSLPEPRLDVDFRQENLEFGGISVVDNMEELPSFRSFFDTDKSELNKSVYLPAVNVKEKSHESTVYSPEKSIDFSNPSSSKGPDRKLIAKTPKNSEYLMKTDNVTPILDYHSMSTPEMNAELDKYGLKPFKRKRAIQLLTHLYNQTHPIVESCTSEQQESPSKKRKKSLSPRKLCEKENPEEVIFQEKSKVPSTRTRDLGEKENVYEITNEVPEIKDLSCPEDDWVFQKKEKAKMHLCRVPLHVAFHNYVSCRLGLREAILRYEPVNIEVIHKGLIDNGFRYDPKELLKFMDRKCITVKTVDNSRNSKKHY